MVEKFENQFIERFVIGFCNAGTPFSTKVQNNQFSLNNPLKLKASEYKGREDINFWDDDWAESMCYFGGSLLGLTMIPIDALLTGVFTVKETFSGVKV